MPKRKLPENGRDVDGKTTRQTAPKSDGVDTGRRGVPEAEVEEFFAIIQCLNDTVGDRNGELMNAVVPKKALWMWQPSFKLEDFREAAVIVNVVRNGGESPAEEENMEAEEEISQCIDLNIKPKT
ncbi:hypothetical protein KSP39_PZI015274 [Platanthera zijinensis]|uniref:Uncharacterized protein n=1 Tax=Platanthera zijinensis TaxID=2320716 RepID=A0AAP0G1D6_9ASPA